MEEKKLCYFCGTELRNCDVCYRCYEHDREIAFRKGYDRGYKEGYELGRREAIN